MIERRDVLNQGSIAEASPSVSTSTVLRASEDTAHENIAHRLESGTPLWSLFSSDDELDNDHQQQPIRIVYMYSILFAFLA